MRKRYEKITYRALKAEIRALLDRPGVVPEAESRIILWLMEREYDGCKGEQPPNPTTWDDVVSAETKQWLIAVGNETPSLNIKIVSEDIQGE